MWKKLTTKTMTVDHIIPLSRGGKNNIENLIALCPEDNYRKNNLLYIPSGFYIAMHQNPLLQQLTKDFKIYYTKYCKETFPIEKYPLISPEYYMQAYPNTLRYMYTHKNKNLPFIPQMVVKFQYTNYEKFQELEAIANIKLKPHLQLLNQYDLNDKLHPIAIYTLRHYKTDKLLSIFAVRYQKEQKRMVLYAIWNQMTTQAQIANLMNLYNALQASLITVGDYPLQQVVFLTTNQKEMQFLKQREYTTQSGILYDTISDENIYYVNTITKSYHPSKKITEILHIPHYYNLNNKDL